MVRVAPDTLMTAHCAFFQDGTIAGAANYYGQSAALFRFDPMTGTFGEQINKELLEFPGYIPQPGQVSLPRASVAITADITGPLAGFL